MRLLGRWDPMLLALKDKSWLIDNEHKKKVWRPGGNVEATLLIHGRIAGTWCQIDLHTIPISETLGGTLERHLHPSPLAPAPALGAGRAVHEPRGDRSPTDRRSGTDATRGGPGHLESHGRL